jgi:hypothetical protein
MNTRKIMYAIIELLGTNNIITGLINTKKQLSKDMFSFYNCRHRPKHAPSIITSSFNCTMTHHNNNNAHSSITLATN